MTTPPIRIGTRKSKLAILQAQTVAKKLQSLHIETSIIPIDSAGDIDLVQPIYELGITGVFTKNLDIALLNNTIDIAVHSLKDIPTQLPDTIEFSAVLERDYEKDVVIWNPNHTTGLQNATLGTGSLRRTAFLRHIEPSVNCVNIRGNVQTRIQKLKEENLSGIVLSEAGIKRLNLPVEYEILPTTPAPGQGVIAITALENKYSEILHQINHADTYKCITIERDFLQRLEGGCTAPIGALATIKDNCLVFRGEVCSLEGSQMLSIKENIPIDKLTNAGVFFAEDLLQKGAREIIENAKA